MVQVVNGGLGPQVFAQVEPKITFFLQALTTYVETHNTEWKVRIIRSFPKPSTMSNDKPTALRPARDGTTFFLCTANRGGSAFECTIEGIAREDFGVAIDALNRARGKPKKVSQQAEVGVNGVALNACGEVQSQCSDCMMDPLRQEVTLQSLPVGVAINQPLTDEIGAVVPEDSTEATVILAEFGKVDAARTRASMGGFYIIFILRPSSKFNVVILCVYVKLKTI